MLDLSAVEIWQQMEKQAAIYAKWKSKLPVLPNGNMLPLVLCTACRGLTNLPQNLSLTNGAWTPSGCLSINETQLSRHGQCLWHWQCAFSYSPLPPASHWLSIVEAPWAGIKGWYVRTIAAPPPLYGSSVLVHIMCRDGLGAITSQWCLQSFLVFSIEVWWCVVHLGVQWPALLAHRLDILTTIRNPSWTIWSLLYQSAFPCHLRELRTVSIDALNYIICMSLTFECCTELLVYCCTWALLLKSWCVVSAPSYYS